jgi:hypothetical protein
MSDFRQPRRPRGPPDGATPKQIQRYWTQRRLHEERLDRLMCTRAYIFETIIGSDTELTCCECGDVLPCYASAEVHHMDGRDWSMREGMSQFARAAIMLDEVERGVWLAVLCKSCNSSIGDPRKKRAA